MVWTTTLSGQMPFRLVVYWPGVDAAPVVALVDGAVVGEVLLFELELQAAANAATATIDAVSVSRRLDIHGAFRLVIQLPA